MKMDFRIVHYLNQFFAGVGGEEKADIPPEIREGAVGPGKALERFLPPGSTIAATVFCGDNYISEKKEEALPRIVALVKSQNPHLLIAGPAFDAGRYGVACAEVCQAIARELGIPCVSTMYPENPGADVYRSYKNMKVYVLPGGDNASAMRPELQSMAKFAGRLLSGAQIGPAAREGYLPRGLRLVTTVEKTGVERALDMLRAKLHGKPFTTEIPLKNLPPVEPAPPLADLARATIAMATTAGIVPFGNPDGFRRNRNTQWKKYSLEGVASLEKGKWEAVHGGYNTTFVNENPNYGLPLDALRALERERRFARLHPYMYTMPGVQASVNLMQQFGREIAQDIKAAGAEGVVLVST